MSGINNNHNLNGNLIVSGPTTVTSVTTADKNIKIINTNVTETPLPTITTNNKIAITHNNLIDKQLAAAIGVSNQKINKLSLPQQQQQQQQHTRRTLLADATAANNQKPPSSGTLLTSTIGTYPNQLQTIATIHQQQDEQSLLQQQQVRRSLHSLHEHNLKSTAHNVIPPRYQPPPQPHGQQLSTTTSSQVGILKQLTGFAQNKNHITNTSTSVGALKNCSKFYFGAADNLNFKYPPDIPQLSTVYIPDSIKAQQQQQQQQSGNSAVRYLHQKRQLPLQQRLRSNNILNGHQTIATLQKHQHQQQLQLQQQHQAPQSVDKGQQQDMLKFVRKPDQEHPSPNASVTSSSTGIPTATGRLTAEQNRQLQSLINELRALKEQNQRLLDDNQELRDLCCFLDDDRQKGRKLAREWQRFGRYTASVMRQEVAAYQNKLRQLDDKQQELITDNLELKELCLYLDEERLHVAANCVCANCGISSNTRNARDDGDGSSSSTNADETIGALRNYERQLPTDMQQRAILNDQTLQYVRSLERRIQQLEEERLSTLTPTAHDILAQQHHRHQQQQQQQQQQESHVENVLEPISGRPEAVVRALQVLEVREQLERDRFVNLNETTALDQMDDGEKALVREMCNVVWRKLEGSPNSAANTLEPL